MDKRKKHDERSEEPTATKNVGLIDRRALLLGIPAAGLLGGALAACSGTTGTLRSDAATDARAADGAAGSDMAVASDGSPDGINACNPTANDALGPFYEGGAPERTTLASQSEPGERTEVSGVVYGPDCKTPLAGAIVDVWHADAQGNYHAAGQEYRLRGQMKTDSAGRYAFESIRPGNYDGRPAHYHLIVSRPGHQPLTTQIYFAGDPFLGPKDSCPPPTCNSADPGRVITFAPKQGAATLLAGHFDVVLRKA